MRAIEFGARLIESQHLQGFKHADAFHRRCDVVTGLAVGSTREGISIVTMAAGYVETDISAQFLATAAGKEFVSRRFPVGRAGEVAEVALLVRRLVEDRLQFLTETTIYIDGGQGVNA
jgi:glucose 1-dehydrogenase